MRHVSHIRNPMIRPLVAEGATKLFTVFSLAGLFELLAPTFDIFFVLVLFGITDTVTALVAARKNGIPISSKRARKGIWKYGGYMVVILLAYLSEWAVDVNFNLFKFLVGAIYAIELLSIGENLALILNNHTFHKIISMLRGKIKQSDDVVKEILEEKEGIDPNKDNDTTPSC